jgi:hypothetical protein
MRLRHLGARLLPSLKAVLAGWAGAMVVTFPMQIVKIVANSFGGPAVLLLSLAEGTVIWGLWGLALAAGGWFFAFLPIILLVPEDRLLRHQRRVIALAAVLAWMVILAEFRVWKLVLPNHHIAVRMFTLYSLLFVVYATISAFAYLRLIARDRENR